jgi:hypothetical protein
MSKDLGGLKSNVMVKTEYLNDLHSQIEKLKTERDESERYVALGKAFELFMSNERFRILGTAKLGEPGYQHIGMEIWTICGYDTFTKEENEINKSILYKYILGMKGEGWVYGDKPNMDNLIDAFSSTGETDE